MTLHHADSVTAAERRDGPSAVHRGYRADIEGLRAVAVLAVVLFHAEVPGIGGGFVGVDVFFVISGFLITGLLWRDVSTTGGVRLRGFYGARARRLLPASAFVGVVTMVGAAILLPPLQARSAMGDGIASALYVSNYRFILQGVDYSAPYLPPSPFQHYWSLGVEEQFYIVWPLLMLATAWLIRRVRRARRRPTPSDAPASQRPFVVVLATVAAVSFALSLVACHWAPFVAFFSLPTRAWQLAAGGLVALTVGNWSRLSPGWAAIIGWAGLGAILLGCNQFSDVTLYPGLAALVPTAGAVMVIGAGCAYAARGCGRFLGLAPMRVIGRMSYSWYLWHWPVMIFAPLLLGHSLGLGGRLTAVLVSGGLAVLTVRYVEDPLRFDRRVRDSPWRSLGLGAVATASAVCVAAALLVVVPAPIGRGEPVAPVAVTAAPAPVGSGLATYDAAVAHAFVQMQTAVTTAADLTAVPSNLQPPLADAAAELSDVYVNGCLRSAWQVEQPDCASGDIGSPTTVAVVGDSNSAMWNPAFRTIAEQRRWQLQMFGKAGCPLMDLPTRSAQLHREYTECERWRGEVIDRLRADPPRLVVVSMWRQYGLDGYPAGFSSYSQAWNTSVTRLVRQLRETGAKVLVLGPIPDPHSAVPICLSGHLDDATACAPARSVAVDDEGIAAELAATRAGGGHYGDITDLFCTADRCPVIVGNTLVYLDENHLTIEYARLLSPAIAALVDRVLAAG